MHGMHFDSVNPCIHTELCRLCKSFYNLMNFFHGKWAGIYIVCPTVRRCRGGCTKIIHIKYGLCEHAKGFVFYHFDHDVVDGHRPPHACCYLYKELGAGLVEFFHIFFKLFELLCIFIKPFAAQGIADGGNSWQDQTHIVLCPLQ